jgi:putative nucleotidyltransferase with HDIG domain
MSQTIILVSEDQEEREEVGQALAAADRVSAWSLTVAASADEGRGALSDEDVAVVIAGRRLGARSGAEFLDAVFQSRPGIIRLLLGLPGDRESAVQCAVGAHYLLLRPVTAEVLASILTRVGFVGGLLDQAQQRAVANRVRCFPALPVLYTQLLRELSSSDVSSERIGELIGRDLAMSTKLIQLVNSAVFGFPRQVASIVEAVSLLGLETVKSLVLGLHAFGQFADVRPRYFSMHEVWRHSLAVADCAKRLGRAVGASDAVVGEAYVAGLLHDLGQLILSANLGRPYDDALAQARVRAAPAWETEQEMLGLTHADAGAYLAVQWGLSLPVVEAVARHHRPSQSEAKELTPLALVHVANVIVHATEGQARGDVPPQLDQPYLAALGLADIAGAWVAAGGPPTSETADEVAVGARRSPSQETSPPKQVRPAPGWRLCKVAGFFGLVVGGGIGLAWQSSQARLPELRLGSLTRAAPSTCGKPGARPNGDDREMWASGPGDPVRFARWELSGLAQGQDDAALGALADGVGSSTNDPREAQPADAEGKQALADSFKLRHLEIAELASHAAERDPNRYLIPPSFRLQGIVDYRGAPAALINGCLVRVGDPVGAGRVQSIASNHVVVEVQGESQILTFRR